MSIITTFTFPSADGQLSLRPAQGVSFVFRSGTTWEAIIPANYNGSSNPAYFQSVPDFPSFQDENFWSINGFDSILTVVVVNGVVTTSGSLDITFTNNNNPIEKFIAIPGYLDTIKLNNGGYADPGVESIFIQLKNYAYNDSIFDIILNKLSEFFTSEGFKQGVTESIEYLNSQFLEGKITIDQFNELVTKSVEELAGQYGANYMKNYNSVKAAIKKYRYLLIN
jgi:hypothetical protein